MGSDYECTLPAAMPESHYWRTSHYTNQDMTDLLDRPGMIPLDIRHEPGFKFGFWSQEHTRPVVPFISPDRCDAYYPSHYWRPAAMHPNKASSTSSIEAGSPALSAATTALIQAEHPPPDLDRHHQTYHSSCEGTHGSHDVASPYESPIRSGVSWPSFGGANPGITLQEIQHQPDLCSDDHAYPTPNPSEPSPSYPYPYPSQISMSPGAVEEPPPTDIALPALSEDDGTHDSASDDGHDSPADASGAPPSTPRPRRHAPPPPSPRASRKPAAAPAPARVKKRAPQNRRTNRRPSRGSGASTAAGRPAPASGRAGKNPCPHCDATAASPAALHRHVAAEHTRPFTCAFALYGCRADFGARNEWKRHVASQHLKLGFWRCDWDKCRPDAPHRPDGTAAAAADGDDDDDDDDDVGLVFNDFNRKDLFVQHVRRMHGPAKHAPAADHAAFRPRVAAATQRCFVSMRTLPPEARCGFCAAERAAKGEEEVVFRGPNAWELRMEHVGKHLEAGTGVGAWVEDVPLRDWLVEEGLVEGSEERGWRLVGL